MARAGEAASSASARSLTYTRVIGKVAANAKIPESEARILPTHGELVYPAEGLTLPRSATWAQAGHYFPRTGHRILLWRRTCRLRLRIGA
jgi:hypothetical protein